MVGTAGTGGTPATGDTPASAAERRRATAAALGVQAFIDVDAQIERRRSFLTDVLADAGRRALVVAVSGGVDSAAAAMLARGAARASGALLVTVRLPYREQVDAADAELVVAAAEPDIALTVDIGPAADAVMQACDGAGVTWDDDRARDLALGNVKARQRMVVQYVLAARYDGLVVGTDHAAEALVGFFTKYGDGGVDVVPLEGLTKRQVRALARRLGVPDAIVDKEPTADLETLRPQLPDEDALGVSYAEIDAFLEGDDALPPPVVQRLIDMYARTAHKRTPPLGPLASSSTTAEQQ